MFDGDGAWIFLEADVLSGIVDTFELFWSFFCFSLYLLLYGIIWEMFILNKTLL